MVDVRIHRTRKRAYLHIIGTMDCGGIRGVDAVSWARKALLVVDQSEVLIMLTKRPFFYRCSR